MQIKTTMRRHFTPVRIVIIKNTRNDSVGKDMEKKEPSCTISGNISHCSHYGKQYGGFSKKKK